MTSITIHTIHKTYSPYIISQILERISDLRMNKEIKNIPWKVINAGYGSAYDQFVIHAADAFDKIGYLRLLPSDFIITVIFLPKSETNPPSDLTVALLITRFFFFLKKYCRNYYDSISIKIN